MSCDVHLSNELRERGFRITPQRRVILHILGHANSHLTPAEVYRQASLKMPGLTETTVYRSLLARHYKKPPPSDATLRHAPADRRSDPENADWPNAPILQLRNPPDIPHPSNRNRDAA